MSEERPAYGRENLPAVCVHDDGTEHPSDGTLPCPLNLRGWSDTFDHGWRAALVALCDARERRRTRRWAYKAFIYLRQRHADYDWPTRLPLGLPAEDVAP